MDRPITQQPTWPRARSHLIEEGRAGAALHGAAISIAISILFPLTWQWRSIIDCNIERHVFPITAPALSISLFGGGGGDGGAGVHPYYAYEFIFHVYLSFPSTLRVSDSIVPRISSSSLVIIVAQIVEAETRMGEKNKERGSQKRRERERERRSHPSVCARENDCSVMHFSRNPFRSSREHRNTFSQIRHCSFHFRFFDYSDNICAVIFRKVPKIHLVSALLYLAVTSSCRVLWS